MAELWAEAEQDADLTTVGGRIRHARIASGMTQQALSDAMPKERRKTRASIAQYESNGNSPSLEALEDIARVLDQDPRFLAFGGSPDPVAQSIHGQQIPVRRSGSDVADRAILPAELLKEIGSQTDTLQLVQLAVDAPTFGVRARDFLLIDAEIAAIEANGRLYAVNTLAGVALVRSEPIVSPSVRGRAQVTGGYGGNYDVPMESLEVLGRLIAVLHIQV